MIKHKVFLDASVFLSALISQSGGSAKLFEYAKDKRISLICSQTIINEVKNNLDKVRGGKEEDIDHFIITNKVLVRKKITEKEIDPYIEIVDKKDAHVLAGAILTKSDYLVTLDKKHLLKKEVQTNVKGIKIVLPKQLLAVLRIPTKSP